MIDEGGLAKKGCRTTLNNLMFLNHAVMASNLQWSLVVQILDIEMVFLLKGILCIV